MHEREAVTAEDQTACRTECSVADEDAQNELIACLLPPDDEADAGCREACF